MVSIHVDFQYGNDDWCGSGSYPVRSTKRGYQKLQIFKSKYPEETFRMIIRPKRMLNISFK